MGGGGEAPEVVFEELERGYSESGRHYHTPAHIDHCLAQFDQATADMVDPDAVEMAIWFHDLVYDARAEDNELRSAERFLELAGESLEPEFKSKVYDLIMVTAHPGYPKSTDEKFMVDIDLSSFGLPWEEFLRDSVAVREEFAHLSDPEFYPRQRAFLESLLDRGSFYLTDFFRGRLESSARENIRRHLEGLRDRGVA